MHRVLADVSSVRGDLVFPPWRPYSLFSLHRKDPVYYVVVRYVYSKPHSSTVVPGTQFISMAIHDMQSHNYIYV